MRYLHKALFLSLVVSSLVPVDAQTADIPPPSGSSPNLVEKLRQLIDRGHATDVLKQLDELTARSVPCPQV